MCEKRGLRGAELLDFAEPETHDYRDKQPERNQNGAEQARCGWRQRGEKYGRDAQQNDQVARSRHTLHLDSMLRRIYVVGNFLRSTPRLMAIAGRRR